MKPFVQHMNQPVINGLKSHLKKRISLGCLFLTLSLCSKGYGQDNNPNLGIIPAPLSVKKTNGTFIFSSRTRILSADSNDKAVRYLKAFLKKEWRNNKSVSPNFTRPKSYFANTLVLTSSGTAGLPKEGYRITITPGRIVIAGKAAGLFYGVQTFIQLLPLQKYDLAKIPCANIEDRPRFGYRGFMLDVCRHFFPVAYVKKVIDRMAAYKLNRFHWHLTDSEGWRIEIKKYPKLTAIAAFRTNPITGGNRDGVGGNRDGLDGVSRGGFYTQEQIREVIKYAADRYITIIPEIEMLGHSRAALRAYPELLCDSVADPKSDFNTNTFCPSEATFQFLEGVLAEIIDLFPGKYIHIGGDEVNKTPWKESVFCQQLIKKLNLKDEAALQSYFMERVERYVNSKGKSIIGWDEILEGGLAPNATVMSWRGEQGGINAAKLKHDVIMTPGTNGMYFDNAQSLSPDEPVSIGFYAPLQKTYSYDPVPASLQKDEKKYILGVQANLWTEFISTPAKVEYMAYPRFFALAEVAWTDRVRKDYKDFSTVRLPLQLAKLEQNGINYRVPIPFGITDTTLIGPQFTFTLQPPLPGAKIYYTLNGKKPGETDAVYENPLAFFIPAGQTRELQTIVISPSGKRSVPAKVLMKNITPLPAVKVNLAGPGLQYRLYKDEPADPAHVTYPDSAASSLVPTIDIKGFKTEGPLFGLSMQGYLKIDKEAVYTFLLQSVNDTQLFIDDENILNNEQSGRIQKESLPLASGMHKIKLRYFNRENTGRLKILMAEQGGTPQEISAKMLFH